MSDAPSNSHGQTRAIVRWLDPAFRQGASARGFITKGTKEGTKDTAGPVPCRSRCALWLIWIAAYAALIQDRSVASDVFPSERCTRFGHLHRTLRVLRAFLCVLCDEPTIAVEAHKRCLN